MSHTYEKVSGNKAKLTFTIPAEQFDEAMQKAFLKMRGRINVPGFRKGKAPRRMIETLYGEGVFYDDAFELVFPDAYEAAVKEFDLHPVDRPEISLDEIGSGKDLKFHLEVFVRPDVTLGEYKGLTVEAEQQKVTDAMNIDMHNILAGSVTVAQPLYLGGRLSALYRSAQYSCDMQQALGNKVYDGLLIAVDAAYWQYISLLHKQQLAQQYYDLLQNLDSNVVAMVDADVATRGDVTKVRVKLNEARMDLTKADCGLELARLALCQICGLDPNGDYVFVEDSTIVTYSPLAHIDMEKICAARDDYRALCDAKGIADQGVRLARAGLLPNVVATGSYVVSNPNLYNGYQNNFGGMFTAGVAVNIPLGHPGDIYALKAAKHKRAEAAYQVEESKNLIRLEVNRLNHQLKVANLKLLTVNG